jgi:hypothetical protein
MAKVNCFGIVLQYHNFPILKMWHVISPFKTWLVLVLFLTMGFYLPGERVDGHCKSIAKQYIPQPPRKIICFRVVVGKLLKRAVILLAPLRARIVPENPQKGKKSETITRIQTEARLFLSADKALWLNCDVFPLLRNRRADHRP